MTTLVVAGPAGISEHDGGPYHPEQQSRLFAVMDGVRALGLEDDVVYPAVREASLDELSRVHSSAYLAELEAFCARGGGDIDPDTYARPDSWTAARRAAGAGLVALAELERRGDGIAFVPVRPPGHHATDDRAMGFCLVNNVAVAAASRTAVGERVLIVDWDVHHGNGTQAIFWDDPDVLYVSTHQHPLYPGTGRPDEVGGPGAPGLTLNMPLPPGATGDVVRAAIDRVARRARSRTSDPTGYWSRVGSTPIRPIRSASWSCRAGTSPSWPAWCGSSRPAPGGWPSSWRAATTRCRSRPRSRRRWARCWGCKATGPRPRGWARAGAAPRRRHGAAPRHRPCPHGGRPVTASGPAVGSAERRGEHRGGTGAAIRLRRRPVHEDGAVRVRDAVLADRAEEHAHELAVAPAAHHEEVRPLRGLDQDRRRVPAHDPGIDAEVGVGGADGGDGGFERCRTSSSGSKSSGMGAAQP